MPDDTIVSMMPPEKPEGRSTTPAGNRDDWLAQLEDASFALQDDSLRQHQGDDLPRPDAARDDSRRHEPQPFDVARHQAIAQLQGVLLAAGTHNLPAGNMPAASTPLNAPVSPAPPPVGSPLTTAISSQAPKAPSPQTFSTTSVEHLMNRLRFSEFNISVTTRGDEMTLWVRDFKQKYASELFHWVKDLGQLLQGSGKSLNRIMVNGKQIHHVNELLGGGKWQ